MGRASMRASKGVEATAVQHAAPMSLADSPSAVRQNAGDVKTAPPCERKGGDANADGLGQPVSVGSPPDLSTRASKGEAVDKVNKKFLENFRRQWLDELEQIKATRSDDDEEAVADMSLAEAFELRDQQACLKKRRKESKPYATVEVQKQGLPPPETSR